jgi:hypothetical protein
VNFFIAKTTRRKKAEHEYKRDLVPEKRMIFRFFRAFYHQKKKHQKYSEGKVL